MTRNSREPGQHAAPPPDGDAPGPASRPPSEAPGSSDTRATGWPPADVVRFNRVLDVLELAAAFLLPGWIYSRWPGRPSEERRLEFLTWLVVASVIALLALGAWLAGLITLVPAPRP
jgi:hypothetical protein